MASVNICIFIGNLTRDPELRYTPNGKAVCNIGLAVNKVWTTDDGEKREQVTFLDLEAWGRTAEIAGKYLEKGSQAHFQCEAKLENWDDKQTGQKRSKIKFLVERLTLLGSKKDSHQDDEEDDAPPPQRRPPQRDQRQAPARKPVDPDLDVEDDDDIPFRSILNIAKAIWRSLSFRPATS